MSTNKILDLADKWGSALTEAIGKHGPEALQLAETVARLDAIRTLAVATTTILAGGGVLLWCRKTIADHLVAVKLKEGSFYDLFDHDPTIVVGCGTIGLLATVSVLVAIPDIINPLAWAGAFDPRVWIAAKLLKL